jgi:hypothetical protein
MDKYIDKIVSTIGDYRKEDSVRIDHEYVKSWLNQFDKKDQKPLVMELSHILPQSYLSKTAFIDNIKKALTEISEDCGYLDVNKFVADTKFLSCQGDDKSQTAFLHLLNEATMRIFDVSIHQCDESHAKNWFYIDDVLASGKTFYDEFSKEIDSFGVEQYKSRSIKTICLFHFFHSWGYANKIKLLRNRYELSDDSMSAYYFRLIENNPDPSEHGGELSFNHVYPIESDFAVAFLNGLPERIGKEYIKYNREKAFRQSGQPISEKFFSSPQARNAYEDIVLRMGIYIMDKVDHFDVPSIRPLGMVPPSYMTLGTGSHAFTWRNISNTCPLIFWWESNGWIPLFPVKGRG